MKCILFLVAFAIVVVSTQSAGRKCGPREVWVECGMCESTCEGSPAKCPPKCIAKCTCWEGLVRHNGECISSSDCPVAK
uniref:TIL domain-containing protein n=1 Tax=Steinernema glaseri TaxID=37863 RepID=A0A1I7YU92_9BILA